MVTDGLGNICIVRDFELALRNKTPLRDNITIISMGYPIMYMGYDDDHRISVYVDVCAIGRSSLACTYLMRYFQDRGVFVLPHILNVSVPINTYTMDPVHDAVVLHVRQDLYSGLVQLCSCLQLSRTELWYSWTRMHTRPGPSRHDNYVWLSNSTLLQN